MNYTISDLIGKTIVKIDYKHYQINFHLEDGNIMEMLHHQDCCENVQIEDITGDLDDLIGSPITLAEERTNSDDKLGKNIYDSFTWTFYTLATIKGYVTIRWLGESNGYYSESVTCQFKKI